MLGTNAALALTNTILVASSLVCMLAGHRAIRARRVRRHRALMLAAFGLQTIFLVTFVTRYVLFSTTEIQRTGAWRIIFWIVLLTHEPMAVIATPLVIGALVLGLLGRYPEHVQVAKLAYPIWLFVSVTGVALYVFLYR